MPYHLADLIVTFSAPGVFAGTFFPTIFQVVDCFLNTIVGRSINSAIVKLYYTETNLQIASSSPNAAAGYSGCYRMVGSAWAVCFPYELYSTRHSEVSVWLLEPFCAVAAGVICRAADWPISGKSGVKVVSITPKETDGKGSRPDFRLPTICPEGSDVLGRSPDG